MVMNSTVRYLLKKIFKMIFTIWVVTTLIFVLIRLMPSNPVDRYIEEQMVIYGIGYEEATLRAQSLFSMELDEPIFNQYLSFLKDVVHLDFGQSLLSPGVDVMSIIAARLPWTLFTVGLGTSGMNRLYLALPLSSVRFQIFSLPFSCCSFSVCSLSEPDIRSFRSHR